VAPQRDGLMAFGGDIDGIRCPDHPDRWLVPPWPTICTVHEVVRHFARFQPRGTASPATWVAFYQGYATALTAAQTDDLRSPAAQHWFRDLRKCIDDCVASSQAEAIALQPSAQAAWVKSMGLTATPDDYENAS
jgi:hypothetical protein